MMKSPDKFHTISRLPLHPDGLVLAVSLVSLAMAIGSTLLG
jgi:hypothetical protein